MTLVLARHLDDPATLLAELQQGWQRGALIGLALPQERAALQAAVLGSGGDAGAPTPIGNTAGGHTPVGHTGSSDLPDRVGWWQAASPGAGERSGPHQNSQEQNSQGQSSPEQLEAARAGGPGVVLGSGGSSGGRRWCLQPLEHLWASADACGHWLAGLGLEPAACLHLHALPLHHVSGLMPVLRAERWGAQRHWLPPALLRQPAALAEACPLPSNRPVLLSLVPTQLHRLLDSEEAVRWLAGCHVIWVGGAALDGALAQRARRAGLRLAPCYGATETAAMVCALPPQRFLAGEEGCGPPLADVELRLLGRAGVVAVRTARLSPGWFQGGRLQPFAAADGWWQSGDGGHWFPATTATRAPAPAATPVSPAREALAVLPPAAATDTPAGTPDPPEAQVGAASLSGDGSLVNGSLVIRGRLDGALHSGGETVFPEQLEQRLREEAQRADLPLQAVLILGLPDRHWGERLAILVRSTTTSAGEQAPGTGVYENLATMNGLATDTIATKAIATNASETKATAAEARAQDTTTEGATTDASLLAALQAITASWPAPQRPRLWQLCPDLAPTAAGKWERAHWQAWLQQQPAAQE